MRPIGFSYLENPPRGFHITFENGWTLSIQWGPFTHSGGRMKYPKQFFYDVIAVREEVHSDTAEIAIMDQDGELANLGIDAVAGYMGPNEVLVLANYVTTLPSDARATNDKGLNENIFTRFPRSTKS